MEWEVPMRKIVTAALAALTLGGSVAATAVPAQAYPHDGWHGGGHWHGGGGWRGDDAGLAVAAGVLGLAAGAAIASDRPYYYDRPYYGRAYYGGPYYGYGACVSHRRVWDPYYGGYVVRSFRYAC
jgi:hypothetical protein